MNRKKEVAVFCSNKHKTTRIAAIMDRSTSNCKTWVREVYLYTYIHPYIHISAWHTHTYAEGSFLTLYSELTVKINMKRLYWERII